MKRLNPLTVLLAVALLSTLCVGSYFATLRPAITILASGWSASCCRSPRYRIDNAAMRAAYAPLLWLDRKIRPKYWSWEERSEMSTRRPARSASHATTTDAPLNP